MKKTLFRTVLALAMAFVLMSAAAFAAESSIDDTKAVSNLRFELREGVPFLCWDEPAEPADNATYWVYLQSVADSTWDRWGGINGNGLDMAGVEPGSYQGVRVETEVNDVVVAECTAADLELTVTQGPELSAAEVLLISPAADGGMYTLKCTGLTPNTFVTGRFGSGGFGRYVDDDGTLVRTYDYARVQAWLNDPKSAYALTEYAGTVSADGKTAAMTASDRGSGLLADVVVDADDFMDDTQKVSNLRFELRNGTPFLRWDAPAEPKENVIYWVYLQSVDSDVWDCWGGTSNTVLDLVDMESGSYKGVRVETEVNDIVVAECTAADMTIEVDTGEKLAAASVKLAEVEEDCYTVLISGASAGWVRLKVQFDDYVLLLPLELNANGTGQVTYGWIAEYVETAGSMYLLQQVTNSAVSSDGKSASFTLCDRGEWAAVSDAIVDEEDLLDPAKAVSNLRFELVDGIPVLSWTLPESNADSYRYYVFLLNPNGQWQRRWNTSSQYTRFSLSDLQPGVYSAFKIETYENGVLAAKTEAALTLTVAEGAERAAATVTAEKESSDCYVTITGLTAESAGYFRLIADAEVLPVKFYADENGEARNYIPGNVIDSYINYEGGCYEVTEINDGWVNGQTAGFTIYSRGGGLLADLFDEEEEPSGLTRGEVCVAIVEAMGWEYNGETVSYTDLSADHPAYEAIAILTDRGIIAGNMDGTVAPDKELTRATLAIFLCRVKEWEGAVTASLPADVSSGHWAAEWICTALDTGLMSVDSEGKFYPNEIAQEGDTDFTALKSAEGRSGLYDVGGTWKYFANGKVDTEYTDLVDYYGNKFYVINGVLDNTYTGLVFHDGNWCYVSGGMQNTAYAGLVFNYDNWYYVSNGVVNWTTGLVDHFGTLYYVSNGKMDTGFAGLVEYNGQQYYAAYGAAAVSYTGFALCGEDWYYVVNGIVAEGYSGLLAVSGSIYYVVNGKLDTDYAGLVDHYGTKYYVTCGVVAASYTGLALHEGGWCYVTNGVLADGYTGLLTLNGSIYYVVNGLLADYSGLVEHGGDWYYVSGGVVANGYTGLALHEGSWYYVSNGVLDTVYVGLVESGGSLFYVTGGVINWGFSGTVDGYKVVNGMAQIQ